VSWQADDRARVARILHGFTPEPSGDGWLGIYGPNEIPVNRRGELPGPSGRLDHPTILITRRLLYDPDGFDGVFGGVPFRRGHLVVAVQVEPAVAELLAARVAGQLGAHLDAVIGARCGSVHRRPRQRRGQRLRGLNFARLP